MAIQLIEIDLSYPIEEVYVDRPYQGLLALVRWGCQPIGSILLPVGTDRRSIRPEILREKALDELGRQIWEQKLSGTLDGVHMLKEDQLPATSVVVCTRDRPLSLERCLGSLSRLDYPDFEVVVVDNGSLDPAVKEVVDRSGFRYVFEEQIGLDRARNRGIKEAQHDIVAFIDDDALAAPGWLRGIAYGFRDSQVMTVTGLVLPAELDTPAQTDFERYGGMGKGYTGITIRSEGRSADSLFWVSSWGVGANMAFRKSLFEAIGDFDVGLDVGTPTCGGGDIEFFYRAVSRGFALRYEPAALVRHTHRRDRASLDQQIYSNGRSFPAYLMTIARNQPELRWALLRFGLVKWAWGWLIKGLIRGLLKNDGRSFRMAWIELWGALSAPGAYHKFRKLIEQS